MGSRVISVSSEQHPASEYEKRELRAFPFPRPESITLLFISGRVNCPEQLSMGIKADSTLTDPIS